ncbi:MAG: FAD-dependent oxidoreductase [Thermoplasmataceae archaeon]
MRIIIIGGGAAGMSAASKAKRINPEADITVYDSGGFVSYAECGIPYYVGGKIDDYTKLIHYPITEFTEKRGIKVQTNTGIKAIDTDNKSVLLSSGKQVQFDKLIICTGASPKTPSQFKNSGSFAIRSLESGIALKKNIRKGSEITIVGDGVLGMELASTLAEGGNKVRMISHHKDLFPRMSEDVTKTLIMDFIERIDVETSSEVEDIAKSLEGYSVRTKAGNHHADFVIFATGIVPNTNFLENTTIQLTSSNLIRVNQSMQTNLPDIFAAGDCVTSKNLVSGKEEWHPLAQISNKMGRVAGANAVGSEMIFPGSLGTTLVKIFDFEVGFTGLNLQEALKSGFKAKKTFVKAMSRAAYYGGGSEVRIEIVYDEITGRLLGSQIISKDGGAWRLNAMASAIQAKFTAEQLFYTDFGYTPPFGPVWDPIIIAASLSMKGE